MSAVSGQATPTAQQPKENAITAAMQIRPLPTNAAEIAPTSQENERNNELAAAPKAATASNDGRSGETLLRPSTPKSVFTAKPSKPSALEVGYAALVDGRLEEAAQAYAQALKTNTQERDALLGMAYIAHQRGQRDDALVYYQRVLRQDPANVLATAAILTLDAALEPATAALRARDLVARQPDSVAAITAAANALVRDGMLAEAAPMFARAQGLEPDNALHTYNHAVALDRLGQVVPAIEQYQRVLKIADRQLPTGVRPFSLESVRLRLQELNQSQTPTSESTP
jgi:tetratricopeptide (TPR) repeat protein